MQSTDARTEETPKPVRQIAKKAARSRAAAGPPADFWDHMRSMEAGDFSAYVYRLWPKIDRRDEQHYVTKTAQHFDEDWLLRTFGSGKYNLRLNNADQRTVATKTVSLHNADYPPNVNPLEVTSDPENDVYWRVWDTKKQHQENPPQQAAESNTDTARAIAALEKVVDRLQTDSSAVRNSEREILTSAAKEAIQTVREQGSHGGVDVAQLLETFAGLTQRFESRPSGGSELAPVMAMMQSQIESQNALMLELLRDRRDNQPAATGSAAAQFGEVFAVMREMRSEFGDAPRPEEETPIWHSLASAVGPALQLLAANQSAAAPTGPGLPGGPQNPGLHTAQPQPHALQANPRQLDPHEGVVRQVLPVIAQPLLAHLTREDTGGDDFADYLLAGYPAELVVQAQQVPIETWRNEIMGFADLWQAMQGSGVDQARLDRFIQQFRDYDGTDGVGSEAQQ